VHSQHQTLSLGSSAYLFDWLDAVTSSDNEIKDYQLHYHELRRKEAELVELQEAVNKHLAERDYLQFLANELSEVGLDNVKPDELEKEHELLQNAEEIGVVVGGAMEGLRDSEGSALDRMNLILSQLQRLSTSGGEISQLSERLNGLVLELEEFVNDLRHIEALAQPDPQRLEQINELLNSLHALQTKHRVNDLEELIAVRDQIDEKLLVDQDNQQALDELKMDISNLRRLCESKGKALHISRSKDVLPLQEKINADIQHLGLVNAQVRLNLTEGEELNEFGLSDFSLEFSSNKGSSFQPAHKVASGGELSRLMLVLKSYLARNRNLPCIIFDEIDTGVSGEIALKMADVMVNLAGDMQVIAITHLPQIASKGNAHFYVYKESDEESTGTYIRRLNDTDRILELAKMLSGDKPTEGAIANARELLN
jgi:DNA repair protein RecN (Recombination protein N)